MRKTSIISFNNYVIKLRKPFITCKSQIFWWEKPQSYHSITTSEVSTHRDFNLYYENVPAAWDVFKTPPYSANPDVVTKMQLFSQYFQKTWMEGSFPVTLWNHFDNTGPRTTNLAEGWHNGLNTTFGTPHPSAGTFLSWLQRAQYLVQARGIQLNAGRQHKQRSSTYRELDQRIDHVKLQFGLRSGWIFVNLFPHHQAQLEAEILTYLKQAGYLIAGNSLNAQSGALISWTFSSVCYAFTCNY